MDEKHDTKKPLVKKIKSFEISRVDLLIRWGGRRKLSGFLPIQSVYSDFYIVDALWPDFMPKHFHDALEWYRNTRRDAWRIIATIRNLLFCPDISSKSFYDVDDMDWIVEKIEQSGA